MGDYIGDKKKRGGSGASGGDTKLFDAVSGAPSKNSKSKGASGAGSRNSNSSKNSTQKKQPSKSSGAGKSPSKSTSSRNTSGKSGTSSKTAYSSKNSGGKSSYSKGSGAKKSAASGGSSAKSKSAAKKSPTGSGARNQTKKKKTTYSENLEAKLQGRDEQELRASKRAQDIKRARRKRNYTRYSKLRNFLFYSAIFIAVTAVVVIMSVTVLFGIEDIVVEGVDDVPYSYEQIVSGCDVRVGQNLFTAPVGEAEEQIMTNLPYIETCTVERRLPSTVVITVTGANASVVVMDENGYQIVVSSGMRVLEPVVSAGDAPEVPRLEGVVVSATSLGKTVQSKNISYVEAAIDIVRILDGYGLKLDSISFSSGGNITAVYDGRINLVIGTATNLENKLELAALLINDGKITKHESGDLDLSIDGKATFTPDYVKEQYGLIGGSDKNVASAR